MESEAIPTPDLAILTSRENLIASAKNMARAMGEKTPQFKAFHTTTLGRLSDLPAFRYSEADHSDERDRRVYVVQLTGSFYPLSGPPEIYDEPPTDGTLSIVYDARTGKQLQLTFP